MLAQYFPLRMLLIDMVIPILCYSGLANYGNPLAGLFLAGIWSISRAVWESVQRRKISIFTLLTSVFIVVELILFYFSSNLYWLSLAIRSGVYGIFVMATLVLKRSFIQIMAEESKTTNFTTAFQETYHYRKCWQYVTAVWGLVYFAKGLFYFYLAPQLDVGIAFTLRAILGFPLDIILIIFSIQFPRNYWAHEYKKGNIKVPIIK